MFAGAVAIAAVAVEVQHVIVAGMGAEVFAKLVERRRTQDVHVSGQALRTDQIDERAGDGAVADVAFVRPRDHEQDVDAVLGSVAERPGGRAAPLRRRSMRRSWAR